MLIALTVIVIVVEVGVTVEEVKASCCDPLDPPFFDTVAVTEFAVVLKTKPEGAVKIIVPVLIVPAASSARVGPVSVVQGVLPAVSADMAPPPVAAVTVAGVAP